MIEQQRIADTIGVLSREMRQLKESIFEVNKRNGIWIQRNEAAREITAMSRTLVRGFDSFASEVGAELVRALAPYIVDGQVDAAVRVMNDAVNGVAVAARLRLVAELAAAEGSAESEAKEVGGGVGAGGLFAEARTESGAA